MSILGQLKAATRSHHQQIERNPYAQAIFAQTLTLTAYRALLSRFYGFYAPLEAALDALADWPTDQLDRTVRRKTPLLARDLLALGYNQATLTALPRCQQLPDLQSVAQGLGCLYVGEGSTLGGQLILRQIQPQLGLSPEHGCAFYAGYGEQTGPMWKAFGLALTEYVARYGQEQAIVAGACDTFEQLERWLG